MDEREERSQEWNLVHCSEIRTFRCYVCSMFICLVAQYAIFDPAVSGDYKRDKGKLLRLILERKNQRETFYQPTREFMSQGFETMIIELFRRALARICFAIGIAQTFVQSSQKEGECLRLNEDYDQEEVLDTLR